MRKASSLLLVSGGGFGFFTGLNIYNENERFYKNVLMPVMHKLNPETSHRLAVLATKYGFIAKSKFKDPTNLNTEVWGIKFSNPIGIAAGFDKHGEAVIGLHHIGFGFVEVGSVTPKPQPGNPKPRVFRLKEDEAIINRYGFNSAGYNAVHERLNSIERKKNMIIGVNLGKNKSSENSAGDYVLGLQKFSGVADYLVINISSPNTPGLRSLQSEKPLEELLSQVIAARNALPQNLRRPVLLKLAPDLTAQERKDIAYVIVKEKCHVDGLIISNSTISCKDNLKSAEKIEQGGLSGRPISSLSTQMIAEMYLLTKGKVPIIGVGGIFNGKDAYEKVKAGASLLQIYTSFAFSGPPLVPCIKKELSELLSADGVKSLSDAVGKDAHKVFIPKL